MRHRAVRAALVAAALALSPAAAARGTALALGGLPLALSLPSFQSSPPPTDAGGGPALVVRVESPPLFSPRGLPVAGADDRLANLAASLRTLTAMGVPLALAPSAVLCDELELSPASHAGDVLAALRELARRSPVLVTPYADVRLGDIPASARVEVAGGRGALARCTGATPSSVLYPPGLRLYGASLGPLAVRAALSSEVDKAAFSQGLTILPTRAVRASGAVAAALEGALVLVLEPSQVPAALAALTTAGLPPRPLATLLTLPPRSSVSEEPPLPATPPAYRHALRGADRAFSLLTSFTLRGNQFVAILRTVLGRARSTADFAPRFEAGTVRAEGLVRAVREVEGRLGLSSGSVTFAARRGSLPVTVTNATGFPVRVRLFLSSPKLRFPGGAVRVLTVRPPGETVVFDAVATSTGTFPVLEELTNPDGSLRLAASRVSVRSTAANLPALVLTTGGAAFLVLWWVRRGSRRRKAKPT